METKQYPDMECDVVIAGCGVAGLYAALNLPTSMRVIMLSKGAVDECDSMLAQGGICVLPEGSDYDAFFEDTMHAGHYENRRESVDIMIRSSRSVINDLLAMGVDFERKADGSLDLPARALTADRASPFMPILRARRLRPSCSRLSASWTTCRFSNTLP